MFSPTTSATEAESLQCQHHIHLQRFGTSTICLFKFQIGTFNFQFSIWKPSSTFSLRIFESFNRRMRGRTPNNCHRTAQTKVDSTLKNCEILPWTMSNGQSSSGLRSRASKHKRLSITVRLNFSKPFGARKSLS